jgi:hypothetical protein
MKNRLCFACYDHISRNHDSRTCRRWRKCQTCSKLHTTGLHGWEPRQNQQVGSASTATHQVQTQLNTEVKSVESYATGTAEGSLAMSIVMVHLNHRDNPQNVLTVYAVLDSMSTACFISKDV